MNCIVIPVAQRDEYLPAVASSLSQCQWREHWSVVIVTTKDSTDKWLELDWGMSVAHIENQAAPGDVNASVILGFTHAFLSGAERAMYLADDCVPSPDALRLAIHLGDLFGLWIPAEDSARQMPQLVLKIKGRLWPAKAWGCMASRWPDVWRALLPGKATYDCLLADAMVKNDWYVTVPLCPRVKDIGRHGRYATPEEWDRYFGWITHLEENYTGEYICPWIL